MVNRVILLGNVVAQPEIKYTNSGTAVSNFRLATNKKIKDSSGNWNDKPQFHRVTCFGKTAEFASKYLTKGSQIYLEGEIEYSDYEDKDGNKRYVTDIVTNKVQFAGAKPKDDNQQAMDMDSSPQLKSDDIPF